MDVNVVGVGCVWQVTDNDVTFTGACDGGTSVVVTFDFGDGSPPVVVARPLLSAWPLGLMARPLLSPWPPGLVLSQSHSYSHGGLYVATVTVANGVDRYDFNHSLVVYGKIDNGGFQRRLRARPNDGKIDNITLLTNSPVPFIRGRASADLWFASDKPPANVQALFYYGDGTLACAVTSTLHYVRVY